MARKSQSTGSIVKREMKSAEAKPIKMAIYLSRAARKNLELLRLKHLDKKGKKPSASQVIESLVQAAAASEKVPYPVP